MAVLTRPDADTTVLLMTTTAATQESKVTNSTITAAEVRKGDKIRVTVPRRPDEDREAAVVYTGVAHSESGHWETEKGWLLYTGSDNAVIELLDRPVPTLPYAIVKYVFCIGFGDESRTAVRDDKGTWRAYDDKGRISNIRHSDKDFAKLMTENKGFEVVFGGVGK